MQKIPNVGLCMGSLIQQNKLAKQNLEEIRETKENMIDVGGYKLKVKYTTGALPAIVFENGGGMNYDVWDVVYEAIKSSTDNAVISYNRAGIHGSELYPGEYDIYKEIDGLHILLSKLGFEKSFIYVGHSYGGFLQYAYANKYPENVTKLLFLDPNTVGYTKWSDSDEKERANFNIDHIKDPIYKEAMTKQAFGFPFVESELEKIPDIAAHCTIITAGKNEPSDGLNAWRNGQIELAMRCASNEFVIAEESNHMIQLLEPDLVIRQIEKLLN